MAFPERLCNPPDENLSFFFSHCLMIVATDSYETRSRASYDNAVLLNYSLRGKQADKIEIL